MTKTYHTRRLDVRGRLTIPHRFRQIFKLKAGDEFRFFYENDLIIIKKIKSLGPHCNSKKADGSSDVSVSLK